MRIFLIRHGRQSDARCNVDVGLSAEGRRQAELTAARMEHWGIERLYSSELLRARETAEILDSRLRVGVGIVPAFRELDFGDMQGLTDEEIDARFSDFKQAQRRMDVDLHYPGGENIADVVERVVPALRRLAEEGTGDAAVATHGGVIRALVSHVVHGPLARWRMLATELENGSITELGWHPGSGEFSLERLNDHGHLEAHPELLRSAWGVSAN